MDTSLTEASKSPFKKKVYSNFGDNPLMTSSLRPTTPSLIPEEKYLALQKELKKLKKTHNELIDQYAKMKHSSIVQKVNIQMELHEAKQKFTYMAEENAMLINRIDFLEKESASEIRNYQRPLNRSIVRSITPGKKSRFQKENASSMVNLILENEDCRIQGKPLKPKIKTERSLQDDGSSNQNDDFCFLSNTESIPEIKFNPNAQKQSPLIKEDHQHQDHFCGNEKCIKHYNELKQMREKMSRYGHEMEEISLQLKFVFGKRIGLKELADYKQEILNLCEQIGMKSFCSKGKPEFVMKKIKEKVKEIMTGSRQAAKNQQIEVLKEKVVNIMKIKQQMSENAENESYNCEAGQKEVERIERKQKELFGKIRETFGLEEQWRQSAEKSLMRK